MHFVHIHTELSSPEILLAIAMKHCETQNIRSVQDTGASHLLILTITLKTTCDNKLTANTNGKTLCRSIMHKSYADLCMRVFPFLFLKVRESGRREQLRVGVERVRAVHCQ